MSIGTLNEGPLHATLKATYVANGGDAEVPIMIKNAKDPNPTLSPKITRRLFPVGSVNPMALNEAMSFIFSKGHNPISATIIMQRVMNR